MIEFLESAVSSAQLSTTFTKSIIHTTGSLEITFVLTRRNACIIGKEANESIWKAEDIAKKSEEFAAEAEKFAGETRRKNPKSSENAGKTASDAKALAISVRKLAKGWKAKPRTVVAVVKFEKEDGRILYEARYTNCVPQMKHAEDFFKEDVENGELAEIFTNKLQGRNIKLCIKPTNLCRLEVKDRDVDDNEERKHEDEKDDQGKLVDENEHLRRNAVRGIKMLMRSGINVIEMTTEDWEYLFGMTELAVRQQRDREIQEILNQIEDQTQQAQN